MSTFSVAARHRTRLPRVLATLALSILLLYGFALAGFYYAMCQPPATFGNVMKRTGPAPFLLFPFESMWMRARSGHVNVGGRW